MATKVRENRLRIDWVINEKVTFILDDPPHSDIPECKIGSYNDLALYYVP